MTTVIRDFPGPKPKMSVAPVQWLPGALSAMLPFFSMPDPSNGTLYLRADDPNIYGVNVTGLQNTPVVQKGGIQKPSNKGFNFYSAPWCIPTLPSRDVGRRVEVTAVHPSVTEYISALYTLVGTTGVSLTDWQFEKSGYAKVYQVLQGSSYVNVNGTTYFGAAALPNTQVSGVSELSLVQSPLISCDFTFDASGSIPTYQMPYNTFYAVDTPIVLSASDSSNPAVDRLYFTLLNNVTVFNGPSYDG